MTTYGHTTPSQIVPTLFAEAFHASQPAMRDLEQERRTTVGSGLRCAESYSAQGPLGYLEKTLLGSSVWASQEHKLSWSVRRLPRGWRIVYSRESWTISSKMAIPSEYFIYQLKPYGPRMSATGFGLLPTTRAAMTGNLSHNRKSDAHPNLEKVLSQALIPTPVAGDGTKHTIRNTYAAGNLTLTALVNLIPTPTARDKNLADARPTGKRGVSQLPNFLIHGTNLGYKLQPAFVEWMMGYPIGWTNVNGWRSSNSLGDMELKRLREKLGLIFPGWTPGTELK